MALPNPPVEIIHSTFKAVADERLSPSAFQRAMESFMEFLGRMFSWLEAPIRFIAWLFTHFYVAFIIVFVLLILCFVLRYVRAGVGMVPQEPVEETIQKWQELKAQAHQAHRDGDYHLAVRLSLTSGILLLNERNLLKMRNGATNSEYLRMVHRSDTPMVYTPLLGMIRLFNDVVYGARDARSENAEYMLDQLSQIEANV